MTGRRIALILIVVVVASVLCAGLFLMLGSGGGTADTTEDTGADTTGSTDYGGGDAAAQPDPAATALASDTGATPPPQTGNTVVQPVVIALQDLPRGFRITDEYIDGASPAIGYAQWPVSVLDLPENSYEDIEELRGRLVRTDIPRESPVLRTQILDDVKELNDLGRVGSDAALLLEPGKVAVAMPLDPFGERSVAYAIQSGDRVDVLFSFLFVEVDETFQSRQPNQISIITRDEETQELRFSQPLEGRPEPSTLSNLGVLVVPQEIQRPRLVTQRTVTNAAVIHVGYFPPDGVIVGRPSPTPFVAPTVDPNAAPADDGSGATPVVAPTATEYAPVIMTIGVDPQDALVLTWALDAKIPVNYVLRSAIDAGTPPTTAVTLQYIIEQYAVPNPPILPFALEPRIQSLRTVSLGAFAEFIFGEDPSADNDTENINQ